MMSGAQKFLIQDLFHYVLKENGLARLSGILRSFVTTSSQVSILVCVSVWERQHTGMCVFARSCGYIKAHQLAAST